MTFTAGEMNATLMVPTMDDNTTELSEDFVVVINSTDQPGAVEIGPYDMALITIEDNDPGTYIHAISVHEVCPMDYACMYICIVNVYVIRTHMQLHSSGAGVTVLHVCIIGIAPSG